MPEDALLLGDPKGFQARRSNHPDHVSCAVSGHPSQLTLHVESSVSMRFTVAGLN